MSRSLNNRSSNIRDDKEVEKFDETVERILRDNKGYHNIVMGDWNSKVGKDKTVHLYFLFGT